MDNRQLTADNRHANGIRAYRILSKSGNEATIRMTWGKTASITVGSDKAAGDWIDLQVQTWSNNGGIGSYMITYVGRTPAAFVPQDPEAEYAI